MIPLQTLLPILCALGALLLTGICLCWLRSLDRRMVAILEALHTARPPASQGENAFLTATAALGQSVERLAQGTLPEQLGALFDQTVETKLTPLLIEWKDSFRILSDAVAQQQSEQAERFAHALRTALIAPLQREVGALADALDEVTQAFPKLQAGLRDQIQDSQALLREHHALLGEMSALRQRAGTEEAVLSDALLQTATLLQTDHTERQEAALHLQAALEQISALQTQMGEERRTFEAERRRDSKHIDTLLSGVRETLSSTLRYSDKMAARVAEEQKEQARILSAQLTETVAANTQFTAALQETAQALTAALAERLEESSRATERLLRESITALNTQLEASISGAAQGLVQAAETSKHLSETAQTQAQDVQAEYDAYFKKMEQQNSHLLEDLDFYTQTLFNRFTDALTQQSTSSDEQLARALQSFEASTQALGATFEEQSRSIGLYSQELNVDVAQLCDALQNAVAQFTAQLHTGTEETLSVFDQGLAEVCERLANVVESVRTAVDGLPIVLDRLRSEP